MKPILIIFAKPPIPGDAKTRLIPHFTSEESADLYSCFVKDMLRKTAKISFAKTVVAYQRNTKLPDLSWTGLRPQPDFFKQEGKSLGERLTHAFGIAFGRGAKRIVIIGVDSPMMSIDMIDQAFKALETSDLVLGPATNGGYYLIGLSRPCLKVFEDIGWSSDQVFETTVKKAQKIGYRLRELPPHYDVQTIEDVHQLHQDLSAHPENAPLTFRLLSSLLKTKPVLAAI